jgi:hypothetical protein
VDGDVGASRARVLERIRQALLDHPVGREIDCGRERDRLPLDVHVDRQACAAYLLEQRVEARE